MPRGTPDWHDEVHRIGVEALVEAGLRATPAASALRRSDPEAADRLMEQAFDTAISLITDELRLRLGAILGHTFSRASLW